MTTRGGVLIGLAVAWWLVLSDSGRIVAGPYPSREECEASPIAGLGYCVSLLGPAAAAAGTTPTPGARGAITTPQPGGRGAVDVRDHEPRHGHRHRHGPRWWDTWPPMGPPATPAPRCVFAPTLQRWVCYP